MKKVVIALTIAAGLATAAQAQYRPAGGEKSLEVNFAPLGGTPVTIGGIKFRSFSSQESAFRLGVFIGHSNQSNITQEEDVDDANVIQDIELKDTKRSTTISVQPGIERHLTGTDRLSPYFGGFVNIGYTMNSDRRETELAIGSQPTPTLEVGYTIEKGGQLNLGLNAVAGFDYYIAEHLFLGTEIGFGFAMSNDLTKKVETRTTRTDIVNGTATNVAITEDGESVLNNRSSWQIGPNVVGQLRLGWLF